MSNKKLHKNDMSKVSGGTEQKVVQPVNNLVPENGELKSQDTEKVSGGTEQEQKVAEETKVLTAPTTAEEVIKAGIEGAKK